MNETILEALISIAVTLITTLLSVFGSWALAKLAKRQELKNINTATEEAIKAAQITVLELQQILVEGLKASSKDGKLLPSDVDMLNKKLISMTKEKMSDATVNLLVSAGVDIEALIRGAGEAMIARMK